MARGIFPVEALPTQAERPTRAPCVASARRGRKLRKRSSQTVPSYRIPAPTRSTPLRPGQGRLSAAPGDVVPRERAVASAPWPLLNDQEGPISKGPQSGPQRGKNQPNPAPRALDASSGEDLPSLAAVPSSTRWPLFCQPSKDLTALTWGFFESIS